MPKVWAHDCYNTAIGTAATRFSAGGRVQPVNRRSIGSSTQFIDLNRD